MIEIAKPKCPYCRKKVESYPCSCYTGRLNSAINHAARQANAAKNPKFKIRAALALINLARYKINPSRKSWKLAIISYRRVLMDEVSEKPWMKVDYELGFTPELIRDYVPKVH